MSEALTRETERVEDDLSASGLLAVARDQKAAEDRAAANLLEVAARWADLHPPEWIDSGGCRSAHRAATFSRLAAARSSAAF